MTYNILAMKVERLEKELHQDVESTSQIKDEFLNLLILLFSFSKV